MTTNQTIDGVPRELLEKLWRSCNGMLWNSVADEIRRLLEAGVCLHDWFKSEINSIPDYCTLCGIEKPADQPQGEPVAWRGCNADGEVVTEWIDGAPPEHMTDLCGNAARFDKIERAYAEQPAPVAVVLPERREIGPNYPYLSDLDVEWNACLDELTRLDNK